MLGVKPLAPVASCVAPDGWSQYTDPDRHIYCPLRHLCSARSAVAEQDSGAGGIANPGRCRSLIQIPPQHVAVARGVARDGRKWGRRDLNPRSTDISGAPRNSRGSSTRPMISRPLGISVWSVVPGASLWSQSPCLAWPQPRVISHQLLAETRIKGFRSQAIGRRNGGPPVRRQAQSSRSSALQSQSWHLYPVTNSVTPGM